MKNDLWEFPFNSSQVLILSDLRIYIWNFDYYFPRTPTIMSILCVCVRDVDSVLIWKLCYFSSQSHWIRRHRHHRYLFFFFFNFPDCECRYENRREQDGGNQFNGNALGKSNEIIDQDANGNIKKKKMEVKQKNCAAYCLLQMPPQSKR